MELHPTTLALLQGVSKTGLPFAVNSGYRDPFRNAAAGGAEGSQHLSGRAVDLDVSKLTDAQKSVLLAAAVAHGARGVGIYPGGRSLHVDTREGAPAIWGMRPDKPYGGMPLSLAPAWAQEPLGPLFGQAQAAATPLQPRPVQTQQISGDTMPAGLLQIPGM